MVWRWSHSVALAWLVACSSQDTPDSTDDAGTITPDGAVDNDVDAAPEIDAAADGSKVIFVTSSLQNANVGGVAGADALCATRAGDAGLSGTFLAWISVPGDAAVDRLIPSDLPYVRTDGVQVAADFADLVDGSIDAPISRDENGDGAAGDVWTGTLSDGNTAAVHCASFASGSGGDSGRCGSSSSTGSSWTDNTTPPCSTQLRLYCVEQ